MAHAAKLTSFCLFHTMKVKSTSWYKAGGGLRKVAVKCFAQIGRQIFRSNRLWKKMATCYLYLYKLVREHSQTQPLAKVVCQI